MNRILIITHAIFNLGLKNVWWALLHKIKIKSGIYKATLHFGDGYTHATFFADKKCNTIINLDQASYNKIIESANNLQKGYFIYFSHHIKNIGCPPNWFYNPFNEKNIENTKQHWSEYQDFNQAVGDIKIIWEPSRFHWSVDLAKAYLLTQNQSYIDTLNQLFLHWCNENPANTGPNWMCGQEASIRVINVLLNSYLLNQVKHPSANIIRFIFEHCQRIESTLKYAMAQNNNHGTSEAAALLLGGGWLKQITTNKKELQKAKKWHQLGVKWLENRCNKLIMADGSFSQYSTNYHRFVLDTLSLVDFFRDYFKLPRLSELFYVKARKLTQWLYQMTDEISGHAPNIGANDGALLLQLAATGYANYRSSVQLASQLFLQHTVYSDGPWNQVFLWLNLPTAKQQSLPRDNKLYDKGGYALMINSEHDTWAITRFPNYQFRPSHADALHVDLWYKGINLLKDAGTYSYNTDAKKMQYFKSVASHNTIQFDEQDQMPSISRFLYGHWLKTNSISHIISENDQISWSSSYENSKKHSHQRSITNDKLQWIIQDTISGFKKTATLRWRLNDSTWLLNGNCCYCETAEIIVKANGIRKINLVKDWESRYYQHLSEILVLEVEVTPECKKIVSTITLKP